MAEMKRKLGQQGVTIGVSLACTETTLQGREQET